MENWWGDAPPPLDLNPPSSEAPRQQHSRLVKRPWNYPGVTAACFLHNEHDLYVIQHNRYWALDLSTDTWSPSPGLLADLFAGAPEVDGRGPFDATGPGITGAWTIGNTLTLVSKDLYWEYALLSTRGPWLKAGRLDDKEMWGSVESVEGVQPFHGPGVTAAFHNEPLEVITVISRDKYWNFEVVDGTVRSYGHVRDLWRPMGGLDAAWQPPTASAPGEWRISQPMQWNDERGGTHLGHDIERVEGHEVSLGQPIAAVAQGKIVTLLDLCGEYFNVIVIEHMVPDIDDTHAPLYSFYGHVHKNPDLVEGQWVRRGEVLGTLANSADVGEKWAAHVHFEVKSWRALIEEPFSSCYCSRPDSQVYGRYIGAGYTTPTGEAKSERFKEPQGYHDLAGVPVKRCGVKIDPPLGKFFPRRYYNPTNFVTNRGGGSQAITNVARGATVELTGGSYFSGGWPDGLGYEVLKETVIDGEFLPRGKRWDQGAVWWDATDNAPRAILIKLAATYYISGLVAQADNNDVYDVSYWDAPSAQWKAAWTLRTGGGWGLQTRPNPTDATERFVLDPPIRTHTLRVRATGGDRLYSVAEVQAFGW